MSTELSENNTTSNFSRYLQKYIPDFCIDKYKRKALSFRERLDIYSKNSVLKNAKPVGSYTISIENAGPKSHEFLVHISSSITVNDFCGESKVTSLVTQDLHCLEEKRNEFLRLQDAVYEKKFYLGTHRDCHYIKINQKFFDNNYENSFYISCDENHKLLSDGGSIILMRYLATINFQGSIPLDILTMDGSMKSYIYKCHGAKPMKINGFNLNVYTVTQVMYENKNRIDKSECLLTTQGQILSLNWIDTNYLIKINPLLDPCNPTQDPIILPSRAQWNRDMEIMSLYLDKKNCEVENEKDYLFCHPDITCFIADFVQTLLCRKPEDVITFTIKYFKSLNNNSTMNKCIESETSESDLKIADLFGCDKNHISCFLIKDSQSSSKSNSICEDDDNIQLYTVTILKE